MQEESEQRLSEGLENVRDRRTFLEFVSLLAGDCEDSLIREKQAPEASRGYGAFGWQNTTIPTFLEAALTCLEANEGQDDNFIEPTWKGFAEFLYGGRIYE